MAVRRAGRDCLGRAIGERAKPAVPCQHGSRHEDIPAASDLVSIPDLMAQGRGSRYHTIGGHAKAGRVVEREALRKESRSHGIEWIAAVSGTLVLWTAAIAFAVWLATVVP